MMREMCLAASGLGAESCGGGWESLGNGGTGASRLWGSQGVGK